jgi:flavin-binding protein dodecin
MPDRTRPAGLRRLLAALLLLGLAACASSPTPYRAATDGFGYSDQQLESNRFRVSFAGNSATSRDAVQNYALYRAAELTVANGGDYFKVVNRQGESRSTGVGGPQVGVGVGSGGSGSGLGIGLSTFLGGAGGGYGEDYSVSLDVLTFQGAKPAGDTDAYDARELLRRLEPSSERPAA